MTGLETIINKINSDADSVCEASLKAAETQCEKIFADAKAKGEKSAEDIIAQSRAEAEKIVALAVSGSEQKSKQAILAAKVELINKVISGVTEKIENLPDDEYFDTVISFAKENCVAGECKAKLNKKDFVRRPADFENKLASALSAKKAVCTLSDENADIDSGIILDYGNIEINCSFEAIIEEKSDELKTRIAQIIF